MYCSTGDTSLRNFYLTTLYIPDFRKYKKHYNKLKLNFLGHIILFNVWLLFTDCCTELLVAGKLKSNWRHWEKTFTILPGSIVNGNPVWQDSMQELWIWHGTPNGFWLMGDMDKAHFESDTFPDCPELVENWSSLAIGDIIYSIEKITCQNTSKE